MAGAEFLDIERVDPNRVSLIVLFQLRSFVKQSIRSNGPVRNLIEAKPDALFTSFMHHLLFLA